MILVATQCFAPDIGGIESLMTGLTGALHRRGHGIHVCADRGRNRSITQKDAFPFPVERFYGPRPWRRLAKARHIRRLLRNSGATHLICDSWKSLEALSIPERVTAICLVHGMEIPDAGAGRRHRRIGESLAKADVIVVNSRYTAALVKPFLRDGAEPEVIHPGVDAPAKPDGAIIARAKQQQDRFRPRLVSVARLEDHKGLDRVIQSLPSLAREFPDIGYLCLGDGPARPRLERLARDLGVADRVLLPGFADEASRAAGLEHSDLFVLPGRRIGSRIEGFGIAFIEAAWAGLPAVAGREGGGAEAVVHGETGLVCDGDDVGSVRDAIREVLVNEDRRREFGARARARASEFAWDRVVEKYERLLFQD